MYEVLQPSNICKEPIYCILDELYKKCMCWESLVNLPVAWSYYSNSLLPLTFCHLVYSITLSHPVAPQLDSTRGRMSSSTRRITLPSFAEYPRNSFHYARSCLKTIILTIIILQNNTSFKTEKRKYLSSRGVDSTAVNELLLLSPLSYSSLNLPLKSQTL